MSFKVICPECKNHVSHSCNHGRDEDEIREAIEYLLSWVPEGVEPEVLTAIKDAGKKSGYYSDQENEEYPMEKQPFFGSQSWSYPMFGDKHIARGFHAAIHNLIRELGYDPEAIKQDLYERKKAEEAERVEIKAKSAARRAKRAELHARMTDENTPLEERIAILDMIIQNRARGLDFKIEPDKEEYDTEGLDIW